MNRLWNETTVECNNQAVRYLLIGTGDGAQGRHSGYIHLSDYIPGSRLITAHRTESRKFVDRSVTRLIGSLAFTRWYRRSSLRVEWNAWRLVRTGFRGLVHFIWAERDWGFFDQLPMKSRPALCATFHSCLDTLPQVVSSPKRLKKLDAIILMSEVQRCFFEAHGVPERQIHVIPHGVDCEFFTPSPLGKPRGFTVLCVGAYRRNFTLLQKVCAMLEPHQEISVKIVAPASTTGVFQNDKNVVVVSGLSDNELRDSYREASCLLMTLESATANNAILEAMACGLPIISEDIGGVSEYTGTDCAMLCKAGSAEALRDAILRLYRQQGLAWRMSLRARQRAKELDWPMIAKRLVNMYEEVLFERGKSCVNSAHLT